MTIYEAIQMSEVLGNAELGAAVSTRIYPGGLPTNPVLPAITYQLISSPRNMTQQGPSAVRPRYQWDCWAKTYDESIAVAILLMQALNGNGRWIDDEGDQQEPTTGLFRRRVETLKWIAPPEVPTI